MDGSRGIVLAVAIGTLGVAAGTVIDMTDPWNEAQGAAGVEIEETVA